MSTAKKEPSYYLAGIILLFAFTLIIGLAGYYTGNWYREHRASARLKAILGFLPGPGALNKNKYARELNFYTVTQNTPNFQYEVFDSAFHRSTMFSDSNGFITGEGTLAIKKRPGTIRIFITGGSGAFGAIQNREIGDTTYPAGTYSYEASIAGFLKRELEAEFPNLKFEVINAATVRHFFNQNFAMYYEKLHDFDPDILISMDGWNDTGLFLYSKHNGNPYQMTDDQSEECLTLELLSRYCSSYSSMLQNLEAGRKIKKPAGNNGNDINIPPPDLNEQDYKKIEPLYIRNSQKLFWLYDSYLQQLKRDGVYAIVSLQPVLNRREMNKQLSPLELKLRRVIENQEFKEAVGSFNDIIGDSERLYFQGMGNEKYNLTRYIDAFYFDKFFSGKLDSLVSVDGEIYVDMGRAMKEIGSDKEFFVDYCHMTPYGNRFIAKVFAGYVSVFLRKNKKAETVSH
jgi:hypothetical protein